MGDSVSGLFFCGLIRLNRALTVPERSASVGSVPERYKV